jgi:hypothetical protein
MRNLLIGMVVGAATAAATVVAATPANAIIGGQAAAEHRLVPVTPGGAVLVRSYDRLTGGEVMRAVSTHAGDIGLVELATPTTLPPLRTAAMPT